MSGITTFALKGNLEEVKKCLADNERCVHDVAPGGETALHFAADYKYPDIVMLLLQAGADVSAHDNMNRTPLYCASRSGEVELVRLLLDKGADPTVVDNFGQTPLLGACRYRGTIDKMHLVKMLIDSGAPVNHKDHAGTTALLEAIQAQDIDLCELLITAGADITVRNMWHASIENYATPEMMARFQMLREEYEASSSYLLK